MEQVIVPRAEGAAEAEEAAMLDLGSDGSSAISRGVAVTEGIFHGVFRGFRSACD